MFCSRERIDELLTTGSTALQRGPLGKLPPELLGLIFDALPEFRDIIFLCLTCKLLLDVGQRRLQRVTREFFAPWAGCRLVCLGDLSADTKLPAGLLTDAEKREIETKQSSIFDDYESEETRVYQYTTNFYKGVFGNPWMDDPRIEYWHGKMAIRRPLRKLRPP